MLKRFFTAHSAAVLVVSVLILAFFIGCSPKKQAETPQPAPAVSGGGAPAFASGDFPETARLVVYTYDAFPKELQQNIEGRFKSAYSVEVEIIRFQDTGGLFNQIYLERKSPKADAVIGLDSTYLARIIGEDILVPYKPKDLKLLDPKLLVDPEYRAVPFDYGGVVLNYDREKLTDPPKSWDDLLDPKYKGKIILLNPATSSPGRNFLLFTVAVFGEDRWLDYWKKLKPNILTITAGWSEGYGLYAQGEAPIVLSYETSPAYHIEFEKTDRYANLFFDDQAYAQVETAGVLKNAANRKNAERFMDHIVSKEFQELIPLTQFMYPVHPDAALPESFSRAGRAKNLVNLDGTEAARNFDRLLKAWEEIMR
jgi:thiamine transport system substrate-binding protein